MIDENYLISIGFSKLYDYRIKKNRDNFLTWANLFEILSGLISILMKTSGLSQKYNMQDQ